MGDKETLDSWKEIAVYIKRSVTTCRRLEHELGLPIHRFEETPKARVFAYKEEIDGWIKKVQHSEKKAFIGKIGLKQRFIPALVIVALAITAVIIWQLLPPKEGVLIPSDKLSLAIMYFKNDTGDEKLDHWRSALCQWLITDLSQSKHINVLPMDRMISILRKCSLLEAKTYSSEDLKRVASEGRVNHIFQAGLSRAGDTFRIDYSLHAADILEPIGSNYVKGEGEESFHTLVDELTRRIKSSFKLSPKLIADDIDRNVKEITTSSPEALKYYTEAKKYHAKGNSSQYISSMEKAIAIDPDFAMAYTSLGVFYRNQGDLKKCREYIQKAMELSDRVSDRERYIIQHFFYARSEKTYDKAIEAYNKLLKLYPDDMVFNGGIYVNFAILYSKLGNKDKAIELSEKARQYLPRSTVLYGNLAHFYFSQGLYDKAEEILKYYEKNISENEDYIKLFLAWTSLFQKKYDLALAEIDRSISLYPSNFYRVAKGDIYLFKGDFINAEREYNKVIGKKNYDQQGRYRLGALYLLRGKIEDSNIQVEKGLELQKKLGRRRRTTDFNLQLAYRYLRAGNNEKALESCNEALSYAIDQEKLDWQRWALYFKGLAFIGMKSMDETQRTADELKRIAEESPNEKNMRWYYHLMGLIELEKKSISKAVEYFKKAFLLLDFECHWTNDLHALFIEPLALAYYQSGDLEKAREEYEKIISLTYGRLNYGDIYAKSFYMLGKIYEEKGWKAKAIWHYEKFFDLWKDADRAIAEVEDARKRLAGLKSH